MKITLCKSGKITASPTPGVKKLSQRGVVWVT